MVIVNFVPPPSNGSPILSYTASCISSDTGVPGSQSAPAPPITVTGLTNGSTYTCTATAANAVGTSPASPASVAVRPGAGAERARPPDRHAP